MSKVLYRFGLFIQVALFTTIPIVPPSFKLFGVLTLALISGLAWKAKQSLVFQLGLILTVSTLPFLQALIWPFPSLIGILLIFALAASIRDSRLSLGWCHVGKMGGQIAAVGLVFVIISSTALLCWFHLFGPDLSDIKKSIPNLSGSMLLLGGFAFALINAFVEEFIFRGIIYEAVEKETKNILVVLGTQGICFGLIHFNGFPRGWIGVGLATIYGLMMGIIRRMSGGLLAPWFFHVVADLTIVGILIKYVF